MKKKKFTKIRENITEVEYQKLLTYLNGKEDLTTNTKNNLRRGHNRKRKLLYGRSHLSSKSSKILNVKNPRFLHSI